eukprot:COSAG06_NODE_615_length_13769_cov_46.333138_3_plen_972_part_00
MSAAAGASVARAASSGERGDMNGRGVSASALAVVSNPQEGSSSALAPPAASGASASLPVQKPPTAGRRGLALLVALADGKDELRAGKGGRVVALDDRKQWIKWEESDRDGWWRMLIKETIISEDDEEKPHDLVAAYVQDKVRSALPAEHKAQKAKEWDKWAKLNENWLSKPEKGKVTCSGYVEPGPPQQHWRQLYLKEEVLQYCRTWNEVEALGPIAVQQRVSTVCSFVKNKLHKMSSEIPYCKVLLLLKDKDFIAAAEEEHRYLVGQQPIQAPRSLAQTLDGYEPAQKIRFFKRVIQDFERKWRTGLLEAARKDRAISSDEAIQHDLQQNADYLGVGEATQRLLVQGTRANLLNDRGFADADLENNFNVKFAEHGCVILHMGDLPPKLDPRRLIDIVRRHSSLFPWLAAVAVRNAANVISGIHVLQNIIHDTHSDIVCRHMQKPVVIDRSRVYKGTHKRHGTDVDCAVQSLAGMSRLDPDKCLQEAAADAKLIVDILQHGHRHVPQYYDHRWIQNDLGVDRCDVYMEWCDVTMYGWMDTNPGFHERSKVCRSICEAVDSLHRSHVAHGHIGTDSIRFRSDGNAMTPLLMSFGSACKLDAGWSTRFRGLKQSVDVKAVGDLTVGIFIDHQRCVESAGGAGSTTLTDGWAIRCNEVSRESVKESIKHLLIEMAEYQMEELCDLLSLIQEVTYADPEDVQRQRGHAFQGRMERMTLGLTPVLQHPLLKWPDHNGLDQRVQWIDTVSVLDTCTGDLKNAQLSMTQLGTFRDWSDCSGLAPDGLAPCTDGAQLKPSLWESCATSAGVGLVQFMQHCAEYPHRARLGLCGHDDDMSTAQTNDAVARFFLRLFPTLFVALFRDLLGRQGANEDALWELSSVANVTLSASHAMAESEQLDSKMAEAGNPSRPDGEVDIFEDFDPPVANPKPQAGGGGGGGGGGVDPDLAREAERKQQQERAQRRELQLLAERCREVDS